MNIGYNELWDKPFEGFWTGYQFHTWFENTKF